jgi:hypothetical protein
MKYCSIIIFFLMASCHLKEDTRRGGKEWNLKLKTGLGIVSILLPKEYDTGFEWIHHTDYERGAEYKYRMQPKDYPVHMESGFFWNDPQDTVQQLTIAYFKYPETDTNYQYRPDQYFRDELLGEAGIYRRKYHWIDTLRTYDHQLMLAYSYDEEGKKDVRAQVLHAMIYHKGQQISFEFVAKSPDHTSDSAFSTTCLEAIRTIRLGH